MRNATLDIDYSDLHWGKYDSPIAQYIEVQVMGNGSFGDEDESDGQGNGFARFGRRVYWWDDQGFSSATTFDNEQDAQEAFALAQETCYNECEQCGDQVHNDENSWYEHNKYECFPGTTGYEPGSLLDEFKQAERIIGTI